MPLLDPSQNCPLIRTKYQQTDRLFSHQVTPVSGIKKGEIGFFRHGQVKRSVRLYAGQKKPVEQELPEGTLQVRDFGPAQETLDLDGDLAAILFGADRCFRAQIHKQVVFAVPERIRVMRNGPALFDQGLLDELV